MFQFFKPTPAKQPAGLSRDTRQSELVSKGSAAAASVAAANNTSAAGSPNLPRRGRSTSPPRPTSPVPAEKLKTAEEWTAHYRSRIDDLERKLQVIASFALGISFRRFFVLFVVFFCFNTTLMIGKLTTYTRTHICTIYKNKKVLTYCVEEKNEDNSSLWTRMQLLQEETVRKLSTPVQVRPEDIKNGMHLIIDLFTFFFFETE